MRPRSLSIALNITTRKKKPISPALRSAPQLSMEDAAEKDYAILVPESHTEDNCLGDISPLPYHNTSFIQSLLYIPAEMIFCRLPSMCDNLYVALIEAERRLLKATKDLQNADQYFFELVPNDTHRHEFRSCIHHYHTLRVSAIHELIHCILGIIETSDYQECRDPAVRDYRNTYLPHDREYMNNNEQTLLVTLWLISECVQRDVPIFFEGVNLLPLVESEAKQHFDYMHKIRLQFLRLAKYVNDHGVPPEREVKLLCGVYIRYQLAWTALEAKIHRTLAKKCLEWPSRHSFFSLGSMASMPNLHASSDSNSLHTPAVARHLAHEWAGHPALMVFKYPPSLQEDTECYLGMRSRHVAAWSFREAILRAFSLSSHIVWRGESAADASKQHRGCRPYFADCLMAALRFGFAESYLGPDVLNDAQLLPRNAARLMVFIMAIPFAMADPSPQTKRCSSVMAKPNVLDRLYDKFLRLTHHYSPHRSIVPSLSSVRLPKPFMNSHSSLPVTSLSTDGESDPEDLRPLESTQSSSSNTLSIMGSTTTSKPTLLTTYYEQSEPLALTFRSATRKEAIQCCQRAQAYLGDPDGSVHVEFARIAQLMEQCSGPGLGVACRMLVTTEAAELPPVKEGGQGGRGEEEGVCEGYRNGYHRRASDAALLGPYPPSITPGFLRDSTSSCISVPSVPSIKRPPSIVTLNAGARVTRKRSMSMQIGSASSTTAQQIQRGEGRFLSGPLPTLLPITNDSPAHPPCTSINTTSSLMTKAILTSSGGGGVEAKESQELAKQPPTMASTASDTSNNNPPTMLDKVRAHLSQEDPGSVVVNSIESEMAMVEEGPMERVLATQLSKAVGSLAERFQKLDTFGDVLLEATSIFTTYHTKHFL
ncbi:hypothetical protein DFQ27_004102 [Actinomortierella ambigua]|uniref:Uncharacterized protein n=1 Tax=Actinomortierella ambigua TaxID=1343610 RepID=A0A9P6Q6X3_9FUNG|nr:hypothetical protein DFQ27_004102 [Actinomortierella ambigua]